MPFTHDAFLDVFGAYNVLLWPALLLIWSATAGVAWTLFRGGVRRRVLFTLLAVHWAWSGIVYHWLFFRVINPAATVFAAVFVLQALLFAWLAIGDDAQIMTPSGARRAIGGALVVYGLVYPLIGLAVGLQYPRAPLFAVPCPTTLVTIGVLVAVERVPRVVTVVPILWAAVGSVAAFALGIRADMALAVAAAVLLLDLAAPSLLQRRPALR